MKKSLPKTKFSQASPVSPIVLVTSVDPDNKPNIIKFGF